MTSFIRKLFAGRTTRTTTPARRPRRLGVETLGERIVPAALAFGLPTGFIGAHGSVAGSQATYAVLGKTLTITDGQAGDSVQFRTSGSTSQVQVTDAHGHSNGWSSLPPLGFTPTAVAFNPAASNESFANLSGLNSILVDVGQFSGGHLTLNAGVSAALETRADGSQWLFANGTWFRPGTNVSSVSTPSGTTNIPSGTSTVYRFDSAGGVQTYNLGLQDAGVQDTFTKEVATDRTLTRTDVLALIDNVVNRGAAISTEELHDLRAIFSASSVGLAADVNNLANKVVNDNPANATFGTAALGDLAVGSSAVQLHQLEQKWFYGADMPQASGYGNYVPQYQAISEPLFGAGGPVYTDIQQGVEGDCYLMASLAEVAYQNPQAIKDMFHDNGDGTYTVRFYRFDSSNRPVADYVTVNNELPVVQSLRTQGQWLFLEAKAGSTVNAHDGVLWAALAEKALAEFNQEGGAGWIYGGAANSYDAIGQGGDPGCAMATLTGSASPSGAWADEGVQLAASAKSAFQAGGYVVMDSDGYPANGETPDHVYAYLGIDPNTGLNMLYNPDGGYAGTQAVIELSDAQIQQDFNFVEHVNH